MLLNFGMFFRCVGEDVGDDPHRRLGGIDVRVAHHELFEDVVLDGARELPRLHALLLGRHDVEGEDRQHGAVHGHRDASSCRAGCPRTESACRRWSRSRRRPCPRHPARGGCRSRSRDAWRGRRRSRGPSDRRRVPAIEGVARLRRREPRVLANGPRLLDVHRRVRPAHERG